MSVQANFRNTSALVASRQLMYSTAQYFRFIEKSQIQQLNLQSNREGFVILQISFKHRLKIGEYTWSFWSGQFECKKTKTALCPYLSGVL